MPKFNKTLLGGGIQVQSAAVVNEVCFDYLDRTS